MDNRVRLPGGFKLNSSNRTYTIEKYISAGSNSIVYQANYEDTLMPEHVHTVLIKELYPLDNEGRITRDESMCLCIPEDVRSVFEYQKASFLLGNQAHLMLTSEGSERIAENLDSFNENGTLYTVLTAKKGQVFSEMLAAGHTFPTLTDAVLCIQSLLYALQPFHNHNLLHLDISPDNIFLLAPDIEGKFPVDVLLLDFNSVYSMDRKIENECQYYQGKLGYMAPEVALHREEELGPWTDLYSVNLVFYEMLTGKQLPQDRELLNEQELVSSYSGLLLHEKEQSAQKVNRILAKGLQILPKDRYQDIGSMLSDIQELLDMLNGLVRIPMIPQTQPIQKSPLAHFFSNKKVKTVSAVLVLGLVAGGFYFAGMTGYRTQITQENTDLDLTKYPLETDDTVVLTERNRRSPLENNVLTMQVNTKQSVMVNLKDYEHPRDLSDVFEGYSLFCFYNGKQDKRGWQFADLTYDFFYTEDNTLHMVLPFQDENDYDLEYVGVCFQNSNFDETSALLDITKCTLTDGKGNSYEMTELLGSHVLYFDKEDWQMNLMTTQNQEYVKSFKDIYGGELVVDAAVCFLDSVVELEFESDSPEIAAVDERGLISGNRQGTATITVKVKDKATGEEKSTQMLVHVTSRLT